MHQAPLLGAWAFCVGLARLMAGPSESSLIAERVLEFPKLLLDFSIPAASAWVVLLACLAAVLFGRIAWRELIGAARTGCLAGFATSVPLLIVGGVLGRQSFDGSRGASHGILRAFEAGLYEEVVFRGVLVLALLVLVDRVFLGSKRPIPALRWVAVGLGTVAFTFSHHAASTDALAFGLYVFAGALLGWACLRWGLLAGVVAHTVYDIAILFL